MFLWSTGFCPCRGWVPAGESWRERNCCHSRLVSVSCPNLPPILPKPASDFAQTCLRFCPNLPPILPKPASDLCPNLPPIYHSVHRKKINKLAVRHLDGGALNATEGTMLGAPVCPFVQVGSFSNVGDKRHNLTVHRHDHATLRNISMSFDPTTFTCKSCQGAHPVLRRTIEGGDVGLDSPSIFVLSDQNFPPMVTVGGGRGMCQDHSGRKWLSLRSRGGFSWPDQGI
jgi:hypothetical protein